MKILISAGNTKREISGPFSLCLSARDAESLIASLRSFLQSGAAYGWAEITEQAPAVSGPAEPWA
jgi:hypothetical protein